MFEDSLMESNNRIKATSRYWSILTFMLNTGAVIGMIVWPLLHPEALPKQMMAALMVAPPNPPAPPPPSSPAPRSAVVPNELQAPSRIPKAFARAEQPAVPTFVAGVRGLEGEAATTPGDLFGSTGTAPVMVVKAPSPGKLSVSSGVMAGNLIQKTLPLYPAIAKTAAIQGTVVLQATIARDGSVQNLRVMSGPAMLQQAALDAVRSWRYTPYLLNHEPVEVETTINVVFNLGR